ncbi:hypothetical protein BGZ96_012301 [Linnemannia gamsii]|uniref:Gfd2/YDR514C-like C-terminal domain-containing protein n=1 Tax=Linnemannia gamsii TaxID=64522 RepID=A0ABQ7KCI5_9FUNG|nr:hypothetical protein BGZ96_012301 [Linnemannia gamsii]
MSNSYLQLLTAMYEWHKECPQDIKQSLEAFFNSKDFLDRPNVFFKGIEDSSKKWVALIAFSGLEDTHRMVCEKLQFAFTPLHAAKNTTFSQVSPAPRLPLPAAYNKFIKDIAKANRLAKAQERLIQWKATLDRATDMVLLAPGVLTTPTEGTTTTGTEAPAMIDLTGIDEDDNNDEADSASAITTGSSVATPSPQDGGMWFISVDIESHEYNHDRILEIGWSIWDSGVHKFMDKHHAISDYRHLKNGKFVADRRDRFMFGTTVWETLQGSIAAFQQDLEKATRRNEHGRFVLIAHDMSSDMKYLSGMGVTFPEGMIQFDTVEMNAARVGDSNAKTGLGKLLDELDIENYCLHNAGNNGYDLHNAGNDAHYTLELFLWLARNNGAQR